MKSPALAIAFSVSAGIFLGGLFGYRLPHELFFCLLGGALFLLSGYLLLASHCETFAGIAALLAWCLLAAASAQIEPLAIPQNHITRLIAAKSVDLSVPLRWRGRLRSDPLRLPWGTRYEIDLEEVQEAGTRLPVSGGLRLNYFGSEQTEEADPNTVAIAYGGELDDQTAPARAPLRAGDRVEALVRAAPARNFGDPGSFDYKTFLARQNIDVSGSLRSRSLLISIPGATPTLSHRLARMRGRLLNEMDAMLASTPERAAVARAMLLGDRSFLDSDQVNTFQETGVYHVLVLAGLHVGILAAVLLWAGRKLRMSLVTRTLLTIAALGAYVAIVEDRPPIVRAALMAAIYLLGRLLFRRTALLNAIGLAAMIILIARPSELSDPSFLLSFLAALTIGGAAAPLLDRTAERYRRALDHLGDVTRDSAHTPRVTQFRLDLRAAAKWLADRVPNSFSQFASATVTAPCRVAFRFWELVVLSFALQLGMLPLMAQYFHRVSFAGLGANVPAVLLTSLIVPIGFLTLGTGLLWHGLGHFLGRALSALIGALIGSVGWFARIPWASFRVPSPPILLLLTFFAASALFSIAILSGWRFPAFISGVVLLAGAALMVTYPFAPRLAAGRMEVTVLDVGQGDSIFVAFPDGHTMLVDGGGLPGGFYEHGSRPGIDIGEDVVSPFLWSRGLKHIDVVALTHGHEDHLGGLPAVLRNFRVDQLWVGRDVASRAYVGLLTQATARGVHIVHRVKGETFQWPNVRLRVLWPPDDDEVQTATNDDSLVLKLEDGREAFLLAGDIERPVERGLLDPAGDPTSELPSDFLKVPHHGSKTSTTQPFLDAVHPRFAAISVGVSNPFGHPSPEVIDRITVEGARIFRTDRDGAITAVTNGNGIEVHSFFEARDGDVAVERTAAGR